MGKLGLVLSGGGSKGAYEIGACFALKKLHKKVDIVTGTSIGAVNGVFVVQKDLKGALRVWRSISFKNLFDEEAFTSKQDDNLAKIYAEYAKNFINDGGYYDNLPINLAIDMGADEIIAVDLRAIGFKKNIKDKSIPITYIAPRNNIGSFLVFDKNQAKRTMKLGYNDTLKIYGKLDGNKFTFKKYNLIKNYNKYIDSFDKNLRDVFKSDNKILSKVFNLEAFKELIDGKTYYNNFNDIVEMAGFMFNLEESNIYNIKNYNRELLEALSNTYEVSFDEIVSKVKNKDINNLIGRAGIVKYFYKAIDANKVDYKYIPFLNREFLVALYLYTINKSLGIC